MGNCFRVLINTRLHRFAKAYMIDPDYKVSDVLERAHEWALFGLIPRECFIEDMEGYIDWYDIRNGCKVIGKPTGEYFSRIKKIGSNLKSGKMEKGKKKRGGRISNEKRGVMRRKELVGSGFVFNQEKGGFYHPEKEVLITETQIMSLTKPDFNKAIKGQLDSQGNQISGNVIVITSDIRQLKKEMVEAFDDYHEKRLRYLTALGG